MSQIVGMEQKSGGMGANLIDMNTDVPTNDGQMDTITEWPWNEIVRNKLGRSQFLWVEYASFVTKPTSPHLPAT